MTEDTDPLREAITDFLQENAGAVLERPAVLVGWALVLDWSDDEGERWLSKAHAPNTPSWLATGMHHEALYGDWPEEGWD